MAVFVGTPGDDNLVGTSGDDTFNVIQGGNDTVQGNDGNDTINFGTTFTVACTSNSAPITRSCSRQIPAR
jgi:Ca2+-binding RTX toxin-like protein